MACRLVRANSQINHSKQAPDQHCILNHSQGECSSDTAIQSFRIWIKSESTVGQNCQGFKGTGSQLFRWIQSGDGSRRKTSSAILSSKCKVVIKWLRVEGFDRASRPMSWLNTQEELVLLHSCYTSVQQDFYLRLRSHMWVVLAVELAQFHSARHW